MCGNKQIKLSIDGHGNVCKAHLQFRLGDQGGMEALKAQAVAARSYALADIATKGISVQLIDQVYNQ